MRADVPDGFAEAILEREIERFHGDTVADGPVFYDRGIGDLMGMPVGSPKLRERIAAAEAELRYELTVFRALPWKAMYRQDAGRTQSWTEAIASHTAVSRGWKSLGYVLVELIMSDIKERGFR